VTKGTDDAYSLFDLLGLQAQFSGPSTARAAGISDVPVGGTISRSSTHAEVASLVAAEAGRLLDWCQETVADEGGQAFFGSPFPKGSA